MPPTVKRNRPRKPKPRLPLPQKPPKAIPPPTIYKRKPKHPKRENAPEA